MQQGHEYHIEFKKAVDCILTNGRKVSPRGQLTLEARGPYTMGPIDPLKCLYLSEKRNLNFFFLFAENLWYLLGRNDTAMLHYYNKNISSFSEDGIHDGAYGIPFREQLRFVVNTLKKDPDTRQAIMTFWRWNPPTSKDVPCTVALHFLIRDNQLNLHVLMRSNDAIWGNNYDVPSFCLLLNFIASCVGIVPGELYLTANSMHIYEAHFQLARELIDEQSTSGELPILHSTSLEDNLNNLDNVSIIEGILRNSNMNDYPHELLPIDPFWQLFVEMFVLKSIWKQKDTTIQMNKIACYSKDLALFLSTKTHKKVV